MKKIIIFFITALICAVGHSQTDISICTCVDGVWSPWKTFSGCGIYGNYGQISLYDPNRHPSEFAWRFTINNYYAPPKTNQWTEYTGTIEYYITDDYPDAKSQFLHETQQGFVVAPWFHNVSKGETPCIKKTSNATIKIAPYKKHPQVYNIFFEGVGFGVDLINNYFRQ